jgi:hypothetical protein
MVNTELLEQKITQSGKTKSFLADRIGCTIQTFRNKCIGNTEFKVSEVNVLCDELSITRLTEKEKIFFS